MSIGIPTRNGARTIRYALESAARQSYPNVEIIVSDNASDDGTDIVVESFVASEPRARVVRQATPITMIRNHEAVWRVALGEYFVWLADDDVLADDFVTELVNALEARPDAVLAFGSVSYFFDYEHLSDLTPHPLEFATNGMPTWRRLLRERHGGYEIKGVMRRSALDGYRWFDHTVSPDWPLLTYLIVAGEVLQVSQAQSYVGCVSSPKTGESRSAAQSFSSIERFPTLTLSWSCGKASRDAAARAGRRRYASVDCALTLAGLLWANRRTIVPRVVDELRHRRRQRDHA